MSVDHQLHRHFLGWDGPVCGKVREWLLPAATALPPDPNEVRQALPSDFSILLERNKEAFATATSREDEHASTHRQGEANAAGSRNRIRAKEVRRYHGGTDDDDEHVRNAIQLLTARAFPKPAARKVAAALKRGVAPPRVRGILRRDISPWFCQSTRAQRTPHPMMPREVILSAWLVAASNHEGGGGL